MNMAPEPHTYLAMCLSVPGSPNTKLWSKPSPPGTSSNRFLRSVLDVRSNAVPWTGASSPGLGEVGDLCSMLKYRSRT